MCWTYGAKKSGFFDFCAISSVLTGIFGFLLISLPLTPATAEVQGHGGPVKSIMLSSDGYTALTGSFDYTVIYWAISPSGSKIIKRLIGHDGAVNSVAFVPGNALALSGSDDGTIGLWQLADLKLLTRLKGHSAKISDVAASPDGRIAASASWDSTIRLWDIETKTQTAVLEGHRGNINSIAFSKDGKFLFSGGYDGTVKMWDTARGEFIRTIYKHGWGVNVVRILPGNLNLFIGTLDGAVNILDIESGRIIRRLKPHEGPVLASFVASKNGLAATSGGDGKIHVWSMKTWKLLYQYDDPYRPIWALSYSRNRKMVLYGGLDEHVLEWDFNNSKRFDVARRKIPRRFKFVNDEDLGTRQFARRCSVCHTVAPDGGNRAGPSLYRIYGRRAGTREGYIYSNALKNSDIIWSKKTVGRLFDEGPAKYTPGSKMPLQRIQSEKEREALLVYLEKAGRIVKQTTTVQSEN